MEYKVDKKEKQNSSISESKKSFFKRNSFWVACLTVIIVLLAVSLLWVHNNGNSSSSATSSIKADQKANKKIKKRAKGPLDSVETDKPGIYRNPFGDETKKNNFVIWGIFYDIILNEKNGRRANSKEVASMFGSKPTASKEINSLGADSKDKVIAQAWRFKDIFVVVYFKNDIAFKVQSAYFQWNPRGHKFDLKAYKSLNSAFNTVKNLKATKYTTVIKKYGMPDNLSIVAPSSKKKDDYSIIAHWKTGINGTSKKSEIVLWFVKNELMTKEEKGIK